MEAMRQVAYATVLRACGFGSLAIFCFMVGLSFAPRVAFQTGGTLTLNGTSSIGTLTQSSGQLNGSGALTATGASSFSGGTQSGSGTTFATGGAAFSLTGFGLDGGRTLQ